MVKEHKLNSYSKVQNRSINSLYKKNIKGAELIRYIVKYFPSKPGVYQMESEKGEILYIGKAKNLAKRVNNYTSINNLTRRLQRMVNLTRQMNFFITNTELVR